MTELLRDKRWLLKAAVITLGCTAALCWVAFANGYPLLFGDTGAYLRAGLELRYTADRSPLYGVLILPAVLAGGLSAVVVVQSLFAVLCIGFVTVIVRGRLALGELALVIAYWRVVACRSSREWFWPTSAQVSWP